MVLIRCHQDIINALLTLSFLVVIKALLTCYQDVNNCVSFAKFSFIILFYCSYYYV
jgi:hypothetical protein